MGFSGYRSAGVCPWCADNLVPHAALDLSSGLAGRHGNYLSSIHSCSACGCKWEERFLAISRGLSAGLKGPFAMTRLLSPASGVQLDYKDWLWRLRRAKQVCQRKRI